MSKRKDPRKFCSPSGGGVPLQSPYSPNSACTKGVLTCALINLAPMPGFSGFGGGRDPLGPYGGTLWWDPMPGFSGLGGGRDPLGPYGGTLTAGSD